ncbi:MAG: nucleotidyltransferase family protein [Candidatus Bathyarchaeia archaeon]
MKKINTAVILVGGAGLRMRPFTEDMPKCMVPLKGKPLIHWIISWLKSQGFKYIVLGVAYHKEVVINYLKENSQGLKIDFSEHTVEGETGEGFRLAISRFVKDDDFLAMNGDEITSLNLERIEELHFMSKPVATVAVAPMRSPFGILELEGDDIVSFKEKPLVENMFVSIGVYIFNRKILDYIPENGSIERTVFPLLAKKRALKACKLKPEELWLTINSVKDLSVAEKEFAMLRSSQA